MSEASGAEGKLTVDSVGLDRAIRQLNQAGHDFTALIKNYQGTVCDASGAFGEFGVDSAWSAFDSAWYAELRQTGEALTELIQNVQAASAGYRTTDLRSAQSLRAVAPR